ncbi:hypothetical protein ACHAWO_007010 [Cyclotella atomus]|uniref:Sulfotransferase domain-containing protein n=1 Tax=Cyclotella atomus TaxID=382360 RepID=A0ABD3NEJ9_9STRA
MHITTNPDPFVANYVPGHGKDAILRSNEQLPITENCLPLPPPHANVPRVFVHIGPHKTGTTSIQDYFACNTEFLKQHNTYYLGKINMYDVKKCIQVPPDFLRPIIQTPSFQGLAKLRYMMHHYTSQGSNVIMSSEDIFNVPKNYTDELFVNLTHVYPVVGYRRYHEWLLSSYRFTFGEPKWYDMERWRNWDGHDNIPTLAEFITQFSNRMHPTLESLRKFYEMSQSTVRSCPQVLNFHSGDVTKEFMKLITEEDSIPASFYTNVNDESKIFAVDAEMLALKLHREGKIHIVLSRRVVVDVIQHKLAMLYKNSTPPLECLTSKEQRLLLEATKAAESQLLVYFQKPRNDKPVSKIDTRFCNINLTEMLEQPEWRNLMKKFKTGKLRQDDFKPVNSVP